MYSVSGSDGDIEKKFSSKSLLEYVINMFEVSVAK